MNIKFKFGLPVVLATIALSSAVSAEHGDYDMKPNGCKGVTLCTAYPECIECHNLHFDIGFLLEEMRVTNTTFGYKTEGQPVLQPSGLAECVQCVEMLRPSFDLDWGLTVSAGYYFDHDEWFLDFNFDWLNGKGKRRVTTCGTQYIVPTGISGCIFGQENIPAIDEIREANARLRVNYFMLQGSLNRASYISNLVAIEPHWGLKVAWIDYKNETDFCAAQDEGTPSRFVSRTQKTNFWGIGPHFGLDSKWGLCDSWSLFCDNSIGLLFGTSCVNDRTNVNPAVPPTRGNNCCLDTITKAHEKVRVMTPVTRAIIGIQYDKCICDDTQHVTFRAGLDTHYYWNQWQHINALTNANGYARFFSVDNSSFSMLGLIVDFGWDF